MGMVELDFEHAKNLLQMADCIIEHQVVKSSSLLQTL